MSEGIEGRRSSRLPVVALAAAGLLLAAALVAFNLLYLSVPQGWTPTFGHALGLPAALAGRWPVPLHALSLAPGTFRVVSLLLLAVMWAAHLLALRLVASLVARSQGRVALQALVVGAVLMNVGLVLTPPALSRDLYHYALFGRMLVEQGLNPYVTTGDALRGDPLLPLASWSFLTTHYGPVFTLLSAAAVWLGGGGPVGTAIAFKLLAALATGATGWAIHRLARDQGHDAVAPVALFLWSPLVLLETAGSGHNETVMLAPALLGLLAVRRGALALGFLLLVASVHVKWVTLGMAGLVALAVVQRQGDSRVRLRVLALLLAIAVLTTALLYAPFWTGSGALGTTVRLLAQGRTVAGQASRGGLGVLGAIAFAATAATAVVLVWRQGQQRVLVMSAVVSLAFVFLVFSWWFPWYLIPALGCLAVGPRDPPNRALLLVTLFAAAALMAQWATLVQGVPAT